MIFTCVYIVFRIAYVGFFGRLFTILPSIKNWKVLEEISEFVDKDQLTLKEKKDNSGNSIHCKQKHIIPNQSLDHTDKTSVFGVCS